METKKLIYMVININKWGGVKSEVLLCSRCDIKRFSALFSVPKAAIFVSLLCMSISLLTLTACSEDDASSIENNPDTETRINAPSTTVEPTDSAGTMHGVIHDWEEGEAGTLVQIMEEGN